MKFEDIKYERLDLKKVKKELEALEKLYRNAKSYDEAKEIESKINKYIADTLYTSISYVRIKNTIDTSDKFYEDEVKYYSSKMVMFLNVNKQICKDMINSPFKDDYIKDGKENDLKIKEVTLKQQSLKVALLSIKENSLVMDYSKTVAQAKTNFKGNELNFYGLLKEMQSCDRETRKEALKAWSNLYESISSKLDEQYDKLVKVRCKQAKRLGYPNYQSMVYDSRNIFDYKREDVDHFEDLVVKYIVPVCTKLHHEQEERLGIDHLYYYDEGLFYKEGAMVPVGTADELIEKANKMYHEMSNETGEYFQFMKDNQFFDLLTKPNKSGGGYCSALPKYKAPFIFSNFNGTSADVDVLTHEAGHAFAAYTSFKDLDNPYAQDNMTMDIAEVHSMSMELFAYPYMDKFFEDKADLYRLAHFEEALMTIPYLCAVDVFQNEVFKNPNSTAMEKRAIWKKIEERFMPWRDYDDNKFLNDGGFWMQKQHIFMYPFYYVDYALSQICAFQFAKKDLENHENAWKDYYKLCQIAGKQGYFETLKQVNLKKPFDEDTMKEVVSFVEERIQDLKGKIN